MDEKSELEAAHMDQSSGKEGTIDSIPPIDPDAGMSARFSPPNNVGLSLTFISCPDVSAVTASLPWTTWAVVAACATFNCAASGYQITTLFWSSAIIASVGGGVEKLWLGQSFQVVTATIGPILGKLVPTVRIVAVLTRVSSISYTRRFVRPSLFDASGYILRHSELSRPLVRCLTC